MTRNVQIHTFESLFDEELYLAWNLDVKHDIETHRYYHGTALIHFKEFGQNEFFSNKQPQLDLTQLDQFCNLRLPSLFFIPGYYQHRYKEVVEFKKYGNVYQHFIQDGQFNHLSPAPGFDASLNPSEDPENHTILTWFAMQGDIVALVFLMRQRESDNPRYKQLLANKEVFNINHKLHNGETGLSLAIKHFVSHRNCYPTEKNGDMYERTIRFLVQNGAETTAPDHKDLAGEIISAIKEGLFLKAAAFGDIETVKRLLEENINHRIRDENGLDAIEIAKKNSHLDIVKLIANHQLLQIAETKDDGTEIARLISVGADVHSVKDKGFNSLHLAALKNFPNNAQVLIEQGIDFKLANEDKQLALDIALTHKNYQIASLCHYYYGIQASKSNQYKPALEHFENAIKYSNPNYGKEDENPELWAALLASASDIYQNPVDRYTLNTKINRSKHKLAPSKYEDMPEWMIAKETIKAKFELIEWMVSSGGMPITGKLLGMCPLTLSYVQHLNSEKIDGSQSPHWGAFTSTAAEATMGFMANKLVGMPFVVSTTLLVSAAADYAANSMANDPEFFVVVTEDQEMHRWEMYGVASALGIVNRIWNTGVRHCKNLWEQTPALVKTLKKDLPYIIYGAYADSVSSNPKKPFHNHDELLAVSDIKKAIHEYKLDPSLKDSYYLYTDVALKEYVDFHDGNPVWKIIPQQQLFLSDSKEITAELNLIKAELNHLMESQAQQISVINEKLDDLSLHYKHINYKLDQLAKTQDEAERTKKQKEIEKEIEYVRQLRYQLIRDNVGACFGAASIVALWAKKPVLAEQFTVLGSATVKIIDCGWQLINALTSPIAAGLLLGPFVGIAGAITAIFSAFKKPSSGPDPLKLIQQSLITISRQVSDLHGEMRYRFDRLDDMLDFIIFKAINEFEELHYENSQIAAKLEKIANDFEYYFQDIYQNQFLISEKMDRYHQQLMDNLRELRQEHIDEITSIIKESIRTYKVPFEKYQEYFIILLNIAIRQSKYNSLTNANIDFGHPLDVISTLKNERVTTLYDYSLIPLSAFDIGFLRKYAQQWGEIADIDFAANPEIWFLGSGILYELVSQYHKFPYLTLLTEESNNIKSIIAEGKNIVAFIKMISKEKILKILFENYRQSLINLRNLVNKKAAVYEENYQQSWKTKKQKQEDIERKQIFNLPCPEIKTDSNWEGIEFSPYGKYPQYAFMAQSRWTQVHKYPNQLITLGQEKDLLQKAVGFKIAPYKDKRIKEFELYKAKLIQILELKPLPKFRLYSDSLVTDKLNSWFSNTPGIPLIFLEMQLPSKIFQEAELLDLGHLEAKYKYDSGTKAIDFTVDFTEQTGLTAQVSHFQIPLDDKINDFYSPDERILYYWLGTEYAEPSQYLLLTGYYTHLKHGIPTGNLAFSTKFLLPEKHTPVYEKLDQFPQKITLEEQHKLITKTSELVSNTYRDLRRLFGKQILTEIETLNSDFYHALIKIDLHFYLLKAYLTLAFHNSLYMRNYIPYFYNPYLIKNKDDFIAYLKSYSGEAPHLNATLTTALVALDESENILYWKLKNSMIETPYILKIENMITKLHGLLSPSEPKPLGIELLEEENLLDNVGKCELIPFNHDLQPVSSSASRLMPWFNFGLFNRESIIATKFDVVSDYDFNHSLVTYQHHTQFASPLFDAGQWDPAPVEHPQTKAPIFTYRVFKLGEEVGSAQFYAHPLLCRSAEGDRHNILEAKGVLKQFDPYQILHQIEDVCADLPPTQYAQLKSTIISSAKHGAIRGAANVLENAMTHKGFSKSLAKKAKEMFYYAGMYTASTMYYYTQDTNQKDEWLKLSESATKSAADTAWLFFSNTLLKTACDASQWLGDKADKVGWRKSANLFKTFAQYGGYSVFAYNSISHGPTETATAMVTGMIAQTAVEETGAMILQG